MPYQSFVGRSKNGNFPSVKSIIIGGIVTLAMFLLAFYFQLQREEKLARGILTKAVIIEKTVHGIRVELEHKNIKYNSFIRCDSDELRIKDSVLIKYASEDPELVLLVDDLIPLDKYPNVIH